MKNVFCFILLLGFLTACGSDDKSPRTIFIDDDWGGIGSPVIQDIGENTSDLSSVSILSTISFSKIDQDTTVTLTVTCKNNLLKETTKNFQYDHNITSIRLADVLPAEAVVYPEKFDNCKITALGKNNIGSTHEIPVGDFSLRSDFETLLNLKSNNINFPNSRLSKSVMPYSKGADFYLSTLNNNTIKNTKLYCLNTQEEIFNSPAVSTQITLLDFNIPKSKISYEFPVNNCRAIGQTLRGKTISSKTFKFRNKILYAQGKDRYMNPPISRDKNATYYKSEDGFNYIAYYIKIKNDLDFTVHYTVQNTSSIERLFVTPDYSHPINTMATSFMESTVTKKPSVMGKLYWELEDTYGLYKEIPQNGVFSIKPGESAQLKLYFNAKFNCWFINAKNLALTERGFSFQLKKTNPVFAIHRVQMKSDGGFDVLEKNIVNRWFTKKPFHSKGITLPARSDDSNYVIRDFFSRVSKFDGEKYSFPKKLTDHFMLNNENTLQTFECKDL